MACFSVTQRLTGKLKWNYVTIVRDEQLEFDKEARRRIILDRAALIRGAR